MTRDSTEENQSPMVATPSTSATFPTSAGSSSSSSSSHMTHMPRRSLAHQPRLLGLNKDRAIELRGLGPGLGLGIRSSTQRPRSPTLKTSPSDTHAIVLFDNSDAEEEGDDGKMMDEETLIGDHRLSRPESKQAQLRTQHGNKEKHRKNNDLAPIRIDPYSASRGGQVAIEEESAAWSSSKKHLPQEGKSLDSLSHENHYKNEAQDDLQDDDDDDDDDDDYSDGDDMRRTGLVFETTTAREKSWMWISVGLVLLLTSVSVAIAVDWIDWPGDGIGHD
ncbi:hypothetical protein CBS101457_001433 [Exobasidium rhododendri]|nr:hypothetical protein CBS101457_001433 [Exobasidium rhododendri]